MLFFQKQKRRAAQGCYHFHPRCGRAYHRAAVHQLLPQHAAFAASECAGQLHTAEPCRNGDLCRKYAGAGGAIGRAGARAGDGGREYPAVK